MCESDEEYLSTGEIAKVTGLPKRSVSTILRRLENKGCVELLTDDKRYLCSSDMNNSKNGFLTREYKAKLSDPQLKAWWIYQREGSKGLTGYVQEIVLE